MSKLASRLTPKLGLAPLLTVMMVLTIIVLLSVITFLDVRRTRAIFWRELETKAVVLADELNDRLVDSLYFLNLEELDAIAAIVISQPDIQRLQVFTPEGRVLVDTRSRYPAGAVADEFGRRALAARQRLVEMEGGVLGVARPVVIGDEVFGGVSIAFGSDSLRSQIRGIVVEHIWQGLVILAVGVVLSHLVARQFVRPIRRLVNTAHRMAAGDLVNGADSIPGDELKELAVLFAITHIQAQPGSFGEKATRVLEELAQVAQADSVVLRIPDEDRKGLRLVAMAGKVHRESSPSFLRPYDGTLPGAAFKQGQPVVANAYAAYPQATQPLAHGLKSLVALPIKAGGTTLGTVSVGSLQPNHFTPNRVRLLTAIGTGLGTLLENARLYGEAQRLAEENAAVAEIGRIIGSTLDIDQVYEQVAVQMKRLVDFERAGLTIIDWGHQTFLVKHLFGPMYPHRAVAGEVLPLVEGTNTHFVATTGQTLNASDVAASPTSPKDDDFAEAGLRSLIAIPLRSKEVVIGCLILRDRKVGAYGPREQRILEVLAAQIAPAVANAQLYEQRLRAEETARLHAHELETLSNIAGVLAQAGSFEEKVSLVLHELAQLAEADLATLRVPDEKEQGLCLVATAGPSGWERPPVLSYQRGLTSVAFQRGELVVANDYAAHPRAESSAVAQGTKSSVFLPIKASGQIFGVIDVLSKEVGHFTTERVRLLAAIADGVGVLMENARLYEEAQRLARENAAVAEIGRLVGSTLELKVVYEQFATEVKKLVDFDRQVIHVIDHARGTFTVAHLSGLSQSGRYVGEVRPLAGTQTQYVVATGQTLVRGDVADHRFSTDAGYLALGLRSSIILPLFFKDQVIATLTLRSRQANAYGPRQEAFLERLVRQIAPAVANAQLYEQRLRAERALAEQAVALARVEELERSRQRIVAAQESLRRDIAAHLHGRVQGRLLALMIRLKEFSKLPYLPHEAAQPLGEVVLGMDQVIEQELAVLSRQLYPSILRQGLVPALQSLGDRFDAALELEMCLDEGLMRQERANRKLVPESVRLSAYRIAEEALTNAVKHARASGVTVRLDLLPADQIRLTVRDNGQGFDAAGTCGGLGIVAMQDYAAVMGGWCVVHSTPGQGTEIMATLPLAGSAAALPARGRP